MTRFKLLLLAAVGIVGAAVVLHLHGPEFPREIHGGKLWPW